MYLRKFIILAQRLKASYTTELSRCRLGLKFQVRGTVCGRGRTVTGLFARGQFAQIGPKKEVNLYLGSFFQFYFFMFLGKLSLGELSCNRPYTAELGSCYLGPKMKSDVTLPLEHAQLLLLHAVSKVCMHTLGGIYFLLLIRNE